MSPGRSAPSLTELQARLIAEFERLGIDPAKVTAQAPQKDENAVFDLSAELIDPDGEGGEDPTGIILTWTERLIADYNQDGMVTANDLTPIGQNYCFDMSLPQVGYDDPALHGGFDQWPGGDPDDGDSGSRNWRLARIDGNADGYILQYDITPIAVHWEERLTGYRIWRKAPGGSFEIVPNPDDAGSDVTLTRPDTISQSAPVRYSFTDNEATAAGLGEGSYAYYVQPWDGTSSTAGPCSPVAVIDNTGTVVPEQPVAQLTVTPDFGGAPALITLDASASTDSDGTIAAYHWDFDADGITDWVSTDAVPETSSAGTVDTITPVSDGVVKVTYRQGSAEWYYPAVTVVDNEDLESLPAYEILGITGWLHEVVGDTTGINDISFDIRAASYDPQADKAVVAGYVVHYDQNRPWMDEMELGAYFAWRNAAGDWTQELIGNLAAEAWRPFFEMRNAGIPIPKLIFWGENGQPLVLFHCFDNQGVDGQLFVAVRRMDSTWDIEHVFEGIRPLNLGHRGVGEFEVEDLGSGRLAILIDEFIDGGAYGTVHEYRVLWYDNGEFTLDDTGVGYHSQTVEAGDRMLYDIAVDSHGDAVCLMDTSHQIYPNELWVLKRISQDNWVEERWDSGNLEPAWGSFYYRECKYDDDDNLLVSASVGLGGIPEPVNEWRIYNCTSGSVAVEHSADLMNISLWNSMSLLGYGSDTGYFFESLADPNNFYHLRFDQGRVLVEEIWSREANNTGPDPRAYDSCQHGRAYSAMECRGQPEGVLLISQIFSLRADPRY